MVSWLLKIKVAKIDIPSMVSWKHTDMSGTTSKGYSDQTVKERV